MTLKDSKPELIKLYSSLGKIITSSLEQQEVLSAVMEEVRLFFSPKNWSLMRYDENSEELFFLIAEGIQFNHIRSIRLKSGEGIAGSVVQTKSPIFVENVKNDPRFSKKVDEKTGFETKTIIAVPMIFRGEVHGVIELVNRFDGSSFSPEDLVILQTIADFTAISLAHSDQYEKTKILAFRDSLTGAFNRNKLNHLKEKWSNRTMENQIALVALLDLNGFKMINDTYGHKTGDQVLCYFADILRYVIRGTDKIFRIGGDEFLILVRHENQEKILQIQNRFRETMSVLLKKCKENDPPFNFTWGMSIGSIQKLDELIHEADLSMYASKG
ncbi:sensor domain-containing diguanylate cyclase [Leptospira interrogans]|uniref:sensor domain-containing diguanylate cyclase n=1 Tax=Leptospira interrogans TaxID=173 RepID=UPI000297D881|nr:sensor domain-containing diguanylate cyclase [Leptospira interrogans]EKR84382.1 diguanylate cyclase (GGDEF) domain protein [Leptospira interrogans str. UI 08452]EMJ51177.1 diguanylate cyclase (GGDEF) domain protein [Leptospira interrogans str. UT126]EMN34681.1 diguanylate cyclase (GGDEF) domain protein [Leptospira interrogans serovar Medanensis str. L0448]EMN38993.1 diguanylate cyclase (GGDEF) domain protein [Leptospira interrogans str. L0996]EMN95569.1 diguanylate cyclase (GGDEF) domain pr